MSELNQNFNGYHIPASLLFLLIFSAMPIKEGKSISALDAFIMLRSEATSERPILIRRKRMTCTDSESVICDESEKKRRGHYSNQ